MFLACGCTLLEPIRGPGTTNVAAAKWGRNSIGVEITPEYFEMSASRLSNETASLFSKTTIKLGGDDHGKLRQNYSGRYQKGHPAHYWKTRTGQLKPGRRGGKERDQG